MRSRRNAVRHGLTAETVIEGLEDPEDYKAFEASITADYEAQTAVERELVLRLASLLWRLRRATSIETGLLQIQSGIRRELRARRRVKPQHHDHFRSANFDDTCTPARDLVGRRIEETTTKSANVPMAKAVQRVPHQKRSTTAWTARAASCVWPISTMGCSKGLIATSWPSGAKWARRCLRLKHWNVGRHVQDYGPDPMIRRDVVIEAYSNIPGNSGAPSAGSCIHVG